jgi:alkaline phosphatase D
MRKHRLLALLGTLVLVLAVWIYAIQSDAPVGEQADSVPKKPGVFRIAFGSCNKQWKPNYMWRAILNCKPDVWIWLGDSIYAPTEDMGYLKSQYEVQKQKTEYQQLVRSCRVIGAWGDNDYGMKNGNGSYSKKAESQQLFLDFVDEPKDGPRRKQNGIYTSYVFGQPGKQIKIVLLDEFYNAQQAGPDSDLLGEEQWMWLADELEGSQDKVVVLGSSIQLLPSEHPYGHWGNYPKARQRLLQLLRDRKPKLTVILSGDRHLAEISKLEDSGFGYPLYEVTSSGLTHHVDFIYHLRSFFSREGNRYRVEPLFYQKNFGLVDVDWSGGVPTLSFQIRDQENQVQRQQRFAATQADSLADGFR